MRCVLKAFGLSTKVTKLNLFLGFSMSTQVSTAAFPEGSWVIVCVYVAPPSVPALCASNPEPQVSVTFNVQATTQWGGTCARA